MSYSASSLHPEMAFGHSRSTPVLLPTSLCKEPFWVVVHAQSFDPCLQLAAVGGRLVIGDTLTALEWHQMTVVVWTYAGLPTGPALRASEQCLPLSRRRCMSWSMQSV